MLRFVAWQSVIRISSCYRLTKCNHRRSCRPYAARDVTWSTRDFYAFCRSFRSVGRAPSSARAARPWGHTVRRATDRLIALQFLAVAVPIAFVLLAQMAADGRRATTLERSRPLRTLAND